MAYIRGDAPYYDRFDESKQFSQVLYRNGVVLQGAELNEMQSILKKRIKDVGDTLLANGDIIEGCQIIIHDSEASDIMTSVTITAGKLYLNGEVFQVDEKELEVSKTGVVKIGVKLIQTIITEADDKDLLDPGAGYANYLQSGAHRLKDTVEYTINDESASQLFILTDGQLLKQEQQTDSTETTILQKVNSMLARRTFDESGNYKVNGLEISEKGKVDDNYIYLSLSAGKAYVKGYEISKPAATTLAMKRSGDLRGVSGEQKIYRNGTAKYELNNAPVKEIDRLTAVIQVTTDMTRQGSTNGADPIPALYTPAVDIQKIEEKGSGRVYTKNQDYILSGNTVQWLSGDNIEPDLGATYTITFTYNKTMVYGLDYELAIENGKYYIKLLDTADLPVDSSIMQVDYKFVLYRRDLITLDSQGNIIVTQGQSNVQSMVETPLCTSEDELVLGSVLLQPMNDTAQIVNKSNTRLSMLDLQRISERINTLEYNQAITDLDNEAMAGESPTELSGIYTDGFIGLTKSDVNHSRFSAAIDIDNQELTLSANEQVVEVGVSDRNDLTPVSNYTAYANVVSAKGVEVVVAEQTSATGSKAINSYNAFNAEPTLNISPAVDNWVNTSVANIQAARTKTATLRRWWYHQGESWAQAEKARWQALGFADGGASLQWSEGSSHSVVTSQTIRDTAIMYMREKDVDFTARGFTPYADNIVGNFDGNEIALTAKAGYQGTSAGTLKANAKGLVQGTFTVPGSTKCGTVELELHPAANPKQSAVATYQSEGIDRQIINDTITTIRVVQPYDPLAQTFQFEKDQLISSVGLYFSIVDPMMDVRVQIRGCDNGYPNTECYAEKIVSGEDLKVSTVDELIETKIDFDNPVWCKANTQYCIVIMTESDSTAVFVADTFETDLFTKTQLLKNPYLPGMLFSSSNALSWTAHQNSNLTFRLYGNRYDSDGVVYLKDIVDVNFDRIMLTTNTTEPLGTAILWEYSSDSGKNWMPITPMSEIELSQPVSRILLRASLKVSETLSPTLQSDSIALIGFKNNTTCEYISKNITLDEKFQHIKMVASVNAPIGSGVLVSYATDVNGTEWKTPSQTDSKVLNSAGYTQYTYEDSIDSPGASNFRMRVVMTTNDSCIRPTVKNLMAILK